MKLKYSNTIKNGIVIIELETTCFTCEENKALNSLGEPRVTFSKHYGTDEVNIDKKIRSSFKIRQKFDGNGNTTQAVKHANLFYADIKEELSAIIEKTLEEYRDISCELEFGIGAGIDSNM